METVKGGGESRQTIVGRRMMVVWLNLALNDDHP
jgi:hypothetical protein